jgi:4'-phosphopantetheinyl transferase
MIDVWHVRSDVDPERAGHLERTLSRSERERAARFATTTLRERFVVRRGLLRWILSGYLEVAPEHVELRAAASGKPALVPEATLRFNAASSDSRMLVAVTRDREVGVDVERIRPAAVAPVAARFFAEHEVAALGELTPQDRERLFFLLWVRKEALAKARGQGLHAALDALEVPLVGCECTCVTAAGKQWSLQDVPLDDDYVAAVAAAGLPFRIAQRSLGASLSGRDSATTRACSEPSARTPAGRGRRNRPSPDPGLWQSVRA